MRSFGRAVIGLGITGFRLILRRVFLGRGGGFFREIFGFGANALRYYGVFKRCARGIGFLVCGIVGVEAELPEGSVDHRDLCVVRDTDRLALALPKEGTDLLFENAYEHEDRDRCHRDRDAENKSGGTVNKFELVFTRSLDLEGDQSIQRFFIRDALTVDENRPSLVVGDRGQDRLRGGGRRDLARQMIVRAVVINNVLGICKETREGVLENSLVDVVEEY